ncbi:hypothetical protein DdX_10531 [Ditylenchus destructor]|uniref:Uncharacterized protein n=1 Tax=Ditylenchus destructor TaxID=166010 RepID=A0AAD4QZ71_9BILA|nr:hypothetical protein DdX_10531 [Ditylenchus destructor]
MILGGDIKMGLPLGARAVCCGLKGPQATADFQQPGRVSSRKGLFLGEVIDAPSPNRAPMDGRLEARTFKGRGSGDAPGGRRLVTAVEQIDRVSLEEREE